MKFLVQSPKEVKEYIWSRTYSRCIWSSIHEHKIKSETKATWEIVSKRKVKPRSTSKENKTKTKYTIEMKILIRKKSLEIWQWILFRYPILSLIKI